MSQNINTITQGVKAPTQFSSIFSTLIFLGIFVLFTLWINYQQKNNDKKKKIILDNLQIGDVIETYSGIIGTISFISSDRQMIEINTGMNLGSKLSLNINSVDKKVNNPMVSND